MAAVKGLVEFEEVGMGWMGWTGLVRGYMICANGGEARRRLRLEKTRKGRRVGIVLSA